MSSLRLLINPAGLKKTHSKGFTMKNLFRSAKAKVAAIGAGLMVVSSGAFADATLTAPTYDTANAVLIGGAVLTGIAVIWGLRQAISLGRR